MSVSDLTDAQCAAQDHADSLRRFQEWVEVFGYVSRDDVADMIDGDEERPWDYRIARDAVAFLDDMGASELSWRILIEDALDVEVSGTLHGGVWEVSGVALLVSYGGPTARYHVQDSSTIRVEVSWGSDSATRFVQCDLAAELDDYGSELAAGAA